MIIKIQIQKPFKELNFFKKKENKLREGNIV
jgi:hypothetical protein